MRLEKNLRGRTKAYASSIIQAYIRLPKTREEVAILGKQMLRAGTSVASHAREASRARSDSEFCSKLDGLLQEADESQLWLELLIEDCRIQTYPPSTVKPGNFWQFSPRSFPRSEKPFDENTKKCRLTSPQFLFSQLLSFYLPASAGSCGRSPNPLRSTPLRSGQA